MTVTKKERNLGIDWGTFYKTVIGLVVPMALQNLINVGVTAADVVMLGAVGKRHFPELRLQDRCSIL